MPLVSTVRLTFGRALAATTLSAVALAGSGCARDRDTAGDLAGTEAPATARGSLTSLTIDVRKDPGCDCCTSWVQYLRKHGANVELTADGDRDSFRAEHGISDEAASCHTAVVEGYAIEGHVPVGAIQRLLADRPNAAGLALPGMPADGPGMGGTESDWERQPVMLVGTDGDLTAFDY